MKAIKKYQIPLSCFLAMLFSVNSLSINSCTLKLEKTVKLKTQPITLRAGTTVSLRLMEPIDSRYSEVGQVVEMMVRIDVVENGEVVIATDDYAEGIIKSIRKPGLFGRPAHIQLEGVNVRTIDGQRVSIRHARSFRTGQDKRGLAFGLSIGIPLVGVVFGVPYLLPFLLIGVAIKGEEAIIPLGTILRGEVGEDVTIQK